MPLLAAQELKQAETTVTSTQTTSSNSTTTESASALPSLSADEKAFDNLALGAWAVITSNPRLRLTDNIFLAGIGKCRQKARLQKLVFQTGSAKQLPEAQHLRGTIAYYRTPKGLQRIDLKTGTVVRIGTIKSQKTKGGLPTFNLIGKKGTVTVQFKDSKTLKNKRAFRLMLEQGTLYLRCDYVTPNHTATQDK